MSSCLFASPFSAAHGILFSFLLFIFLVFSASHPSLTTGEGITWQFLISVRFSPRCIMSSSSILMYEEFSLTEYCQLKRYYCLVFINHDLHVSSQFSHSLFLHDHSDPHSALVIPLPQFSSFQFLVFFRTLPWLRLLLSTVVHISQIRVLPSLAYLVSSPLHFLRYHYSNSVFFSIYHTDCIFPPNSFALLRLRLVSCTHNILIFPIFISNTSLPRALQAQHAASPPQGKGASAFSRHRSCRGSPRRRRRSGKTCASLTREPRVTLLLGFELLLAA